MEPAYSRQIVCFEIVCESVQSVNPTRSNSLKELACRLASLTLCLVADWLASIGLDPLKLGTHSLHRKKAKLTYRCMVNLRVVQLLLGHTEIESTARYVGIEIADKIDI
jgi:integrase